MNKTNLVEIVQEQGLAESEAKSLTEGFGEFLKEIQKFDKRAKSIVVKDESEVELMQEAREIRLELKAIRVGAEKVRKEKKEAFLRGGKAVDGIANIIKATVVPLEEHLEKQEKFVEIREEQRKEKANSERISELSKYVEDVSVYDLKDMSDEGFAKLLETHKGAFEAQKKAEEEAEKERIAQEKAEKAEQEKTKQENEKLKKEAEEREKKESEAQKKRDEEQSKLEAERKKEAEEKAKIEKELQDKKEAEEEAMRVAEEKKKEEDLVSKRENYKKWLKENGYTEETKSDFYVENKTDVVVLYKRVSVFTK